MLRSFRAPGRVNLIGEHTDYAGGLVLPAAIDRFVTVTGEEADGVELQSEGAPAGWERYVEAVVEEVVAATGLRGRITSDLPIGAGLASSAALEVAVAVALCGVAGREIEPLELAEACRRAEERAVGVPCGIMDQAASLLGRAGHAVLLDCSTLEHRLVRLPADLALVVIHSGIERRLEDAPYAQRRAELEAGHPLRVRHVESENKRVLAVAEALEADDRAALGRLFREGHASLRDDFEVSTPELDLLVDLAYEADAVAARLTGAGFGGAIVVLADVEAAEPLGAEVTARYADRTGRTGRVLVCLAADGAAEVDPGYTEPPERP